MLINNIYSQYTSQIILFCIIFERHNHSHLAVIIDFHYVSVFVILFCWCESLLWPVVAVGNRKICLEFFLKYNMMKLYSHQMCYYLKSTSRKYREVDAWLTFPDATIR